jgi:hypothetical protein
MRQGTDEEGHDMSPGDVNRFLGRLSRAPRCPACGGVDLLSLGFIHHEADCPRSPCQFCGVEVMPMERRTVYNGRTAHLDCAVDWEYDRDKEL